MGSPIVHYITRGTIINIISIAFMGYGKIDINGGFNIAFTDGE